MADKYRLNDLQNCLEDVQGVCNVFGRMARMLEDSDEVQDKEQCIEMTDRITVQLNEIKQMLQEDIMLEELS